MIPIARSRWLVEQLTVRKGYPFPTVWHEERAGRELCTVLEPGEPIDANLIKESAGAHTRCCEKTGGCCSYIPVLCSISTGSQHADLLTSKLIIFCLN